MLIKNIKEFIGNLKLSPIESDAKFHLLLTNHFKHRKDEDTLTESDLSLFLEQFKERWLEIKNTQTNYTIDSGGVNTSWIKLAKELAAFKKKSYIKILFPDVINIVDLISLRPLNANTDPTALYLGYDGKI